MRDVLDLEPGTVILSDDPYIASYPHLLDFFKSKEVITASDIVCGAHMVYGWMPTVLELYPDAGKCDLASAAATLNRVKAGAFISGAEVEALASLVNNSLVGASKLLHFAAPEAYAIWDSKVFAFVHEKRPHHYRVNNVNSYLDYLARLREETVRPEFSAFHASINRKVGYKVSALRAIELVMFLNAPVYGP